MIRSTLQVAAAVVLVIVAFANVGAFIRHTGEVVSLGQGDGVVAQENRLRGIREALLAAHYTKGVVGYMPAGVLKGRARTSDEDVAWVQARYVIIPLNLRQDTLDAPYVILDMAGWEGEPEIPEGFTSIYGPREGLVLLQKKVQP